MKTFAEDLKAEQIYEDLLPAIITLEVEAKDGHKSAGSAFLAMKEGLAVTAWHLVHEAAKVTAKFSDNKVVVVLGVVDKDEEKDIALIRLSTSRRPIGQLSPVSPRVGSRAYVIGSAREFEFCITDGLISQVQKLDGYQQYQFTCPVSAGTSGSPVVNSEGKVIGVVCWTRKNSQNLNFATPSTYVLQLNPSLPMVAWTEPQNPLASTRLAPTKTD